MEEKLFVNALSSLLIVSDYAEYLDTRRSFIIDNLCKLGYPKDAAISFLMKCGDLEQQRAEKYLDEINKKGLDSEFEQWSDQDDVIEERKRGIVTALSLGMSVLTDPHRIQ